MAVIPSFESILLEIHQSLGGKSFQTKHKKGFADLGLELSKHTEMGREILKEITNALEFDSAAAEDALKYLSDFAYFHKYVELRTWTWGASQAQVTWYILGYSLVPGLARAFAFWNLASRFDPGMPGGQFWFLPHIDGSTGNLVLPVPQVVNWLLDLLGKPMDQARNELGGERARRTKDNHSNKWEAIERTLYNWKAGNVPTIQTIEDYFPDDAAPDFEGAFSDDSDSSLESRYGAAIKFVAKKGLDADSLREQIPIIQPGHLETVLGGQCSDEEKLFFVESLRSRYGRPDMRTVRQRFRIARMAQDGYRRLVKALCPGVDESCTDPSKNKVLQLTEIFGRVYNLTIAASSACNTEDEQDRWFDDHLMPWDKETICLAIAPSKRASAAPEVASLLTRRFSQMEKDTHLANLMPTSADEESKLNFFTKVAQHVAEEYEEDGRYEHLCNRVRTHSPWRTLQGEHNYWVTSKIAGNEQLSSCAREAALKRMRELATSPRQTMYAILLELGILLNSLAKDRPKDVSKRVEALFVEAETIQNAQEWKPLLTQYLAKHHLAKNELKEATRLFREALGACSVQSFGTLRGEIAMDGFATELADCWLIPENHEKYYRNMLSFGLINGGEPVEEVAKMVSNYFWKSLYRPYPGVPRMKSTADDNAEAFRKEVFPLIVNDDWGALTSWIERNYKKFRSDKTRVVTGDSILMTWIKNFNHTASGIREGGRFLSPYFNLPMQDVGVFMRNWRNAILLLAKTWPQQLNIADFKKQTPLMLAAGRGDEMLVKGFLGIGADVNARDHIGRTPLSSAIASRSVECVVRILENKPDANMVTAGEEKSTPLHTAVRVGHPEIVRLVLRYAPVLISKQDALGQTPLRLAYHILADLLGLRLYMESEGRTTGSRDDFETIISMLTEAETSRARG